MRLASPKCAAPHFCRDEKIYVAGHTGLVGSALLRQLAARGYRSLVVRKHRELDLTEQAAVRLFLEEERPAYVFLAAAKVGGILANSTYPADFITQNLAIQQNVVHESWRSGVKRLLFLGSSCIYPRDCPQPIREEYLLTGSLEPTNRPYAIAKIAGIEMCWTYNRQYGTRYLAVMPTNMYGPGDNYDLETSHVLPALIRKVHEAKMHGARQVAIWGSGRPRREFLYSDDLADACLDLMALRDDDFDRLFSDAHEPPLVNVGSGVDHTIVELGDFVKDALDYAGSFEFDTSKPDGTLRKLLDVSLLADLGWSPKISLDVGIRLAHADFVKRGLSMGVERQPAADDL